jgi:hypothetical protein
MSGEPGLELPPSVGVGEALETEGVISDITGDDKMMEGI